MGDLPIDKLVKLVLDMCTFTHARKEVQNAINYLYSILNFPGLLR